MSDSSLITWFEDHKDITQLVVGVFDYNGILRGKRMPIDKLPSLLDQGFKMPLSIIQTDIWGRDIDGSPLLFETGDGDGHVTLLARPPLRLSWMTEPTALLIGAFTSEGDRDALPCPRARLSQIMQGYDETGMRLRAGIEMEFYLLDERTNAPASSSMMGQATLAGDTLSLHHLDDFDALLAEITALCTAQGIMLDTVTSELGRGQFEITFAPKDDICELADDILTFKYLVKGLAKSHGIRASFMAKPLTGEAGSGLHIHASLIDKAGQNLFHDEAANGPALLSHAVAGILAMMQVSTLLLAPHMNSYRRLVPSSHAPTKICWGDDNRTASIRIPAAPPEARRLEYRSAGADCNPYFLFSVMAWSLAKGMADKMPSPDPVSGNAYDQAFDDLPSEMGDAMALFQESEAMVEACGALLHRYFLDTKRQEWTRFANHVSSFEYDSLSPNL